MTSKGAVALARRHLGPTRGSRIGSSLVADLAADIDTLAARRVRQALKTKRRRRA